MKKNYLRNCIVGCSFIIILSSAIFSASGPGGGYSNAPNEQNCASCHGSSSIITSGNSNLTNLRLKGSFTGNGYIPDSTYSMEVTYMESGIARFGFQVTCLDKSDNPCGTLTGGNSRVNKTTTVISGQTREYIEHTFTGTDPVATDSTRWTFTWKAPSTNLGTVKFYVVINAANNSGTADGGDVIYGKVFQVAPSTLLPRAIAKSNDSVTCTNYNVQLQGSGTNSPTSYSWKLTGGNPSSSITQNQVVSYTTAGTKQAILTVKNSKGSSLPDTLDIVVSNSPTAIILNGSAGSVCQGDSLLLTANTGTSITYLWPHNNKTTRTAYAKNQGDYSVKVISTITGCSTLSTPFTLSWYPNPTISISKTATNDTFCKNYNQTFTATGILIDSVHWYVNGILTRRTKTLTTVFTGSNSINVFAIAKSTNGCKSAVSNTVKIITVQEFFPLNIVSFKTTSTISVSWKKPAGINSLKYSFNKVNYFNTTTDTTLNLTGLLPNTSYDITLRSFQGSPCNFTETTITVKTNACSNIIYSIDFPNRTCKGNSLTITLKNLYAAKYGLSFNNNPYSKDTVYTFTPSGSDSLDVYISDSLSPTCAPIFERMGYTIDTLIDKDTSSTVKTINTCVNTYNMVIPSGYDTYEFYKNNVFVVSGTVNSHLFTGVISGDKFTAKGIINTCSRNYGPHTLTVNPLPVATYNYSRFQVSYTFTADGTNSLYTWKAGSGILGTGNPLTKDMTAFDNQSVNIKLITETSKGCIDSSSQNITVPHFSSVNPVEDVQFKVYPNPFGDLLHIESAVSSYSVTIVDHMGRNVFTMNSEHQDQPIETSAWSSGLYHIIITDSDNRVINFTYLKN